ncbi:MAG: DUF4830 domain-containing protein [Oscillospiraceae bacterium]|jgi:hypothetical protein|nr:DUF4830 domain-containing protein [Oscillospiraceae bacterium]
MFIFTAKLDKRKAVASLVGLAVVICVLVIVVAHLKNVGTGTVNANDTLKTAPNSLRTNGDIVKYLASLGWSVDEVPLESLDIVIPTEFSGQYADYAALQAKQGLNLANYSGRQATRYTYRVLNYPTGDPDVVADVIVCGGALIAGDIQNPGLDGFMQGLLR